MEHLGKTLKEHLNEHKKPLSKEQVCNIGIQMITVLEKLHSIGKVYNDFKPDNILFKNIDAKANEPLSNISLIDFGLCTSFQDQ